MNSLSCLLFDLDGTLYLQRPLRKRMLRLLLINCLHHPFSGYRALKIISSYRHAQEAMRNSPASSLPLAERQLRWAAEKTHIQIEKIAETIGYWMEERPLSILPSLVPAGLPEFLKMARTAGLKLGVVSDYPASAKLKAMKLDHYFDVLVSAQDENVQSFKPNPAGLTAALERLGCPAEQTMYIGDRPEIDGEVARCAGIRFMLFDPRSKYDNPKHSERFKSYQELASILLK